MPGCGQFNESAIAVVRDQLFLDSATGVHLNRIGSNLGVDRPVIGFSDDQWRAIVKLIALQPKLIRNLFLRVLEVIVGPQFSRVGVLQNSANVNDITLTALDPYPFVQTGTLIIDPGMATQETVDYCIRDLNTNVFQLQSRLHFNHTPIAPGSSFLSSSVAALTTSLPLFNSSLLPTSNFPYPVLIGRGTVSEEVVQVIGNNTSTNTLLLAGTGTAEAHNGPTPQPLVLPLSAASNAGSVNLFFTPAGTAQFPATGYVRINQGGGSDEIVQFVTNDYIDGALILGAPLKNSHSSGEMVNLVLPGELVDVCQLLESGVYWSIFEPQPRHVYINIPKNVIPDRIYDATRLHGSDVTFSTTLSSNVASSDESLPVVSVSGAPLAGLININGGSTLFYTNKFSTTDVTATINGAILAGAIQLPYTLSQFSSIDFPKITFPYTVLVDPSGGNQEIATVIAVDAVKKVLTLKIGLTNSHSSGEVIQLRNQFILDKPLGSTATAGQTVNFVSSSYIGTVLENGNIFDNLGHAILNQFPGGYIFDLTQQGPSAINTFLNVQVPPIINVAFSQVAGTTNLEVNDASLWPATPFTAFLVRIGENNGKVEDRTLSNITLKGAATATVNGAVSSGVTTLPYTLTSSGPFPQSTDAVHPAGYRIQINPGGGNQETIIIRQNDPIGHTFTTFSPLVNSHVNGEPIVLLNDVMTFDTLTKAHNAAVINPSKFGDSVHAYTSVLSVSPPPTNFPTVNGVVWLNFGKEILDQRQRITSITSPTIYQLASTANLPTSNYPYQVTLGEGLFTEEKVFVTNNNTGTNTLTFQLPGAVNTHQVGEYVKFISGVPEVVQYSRKVGSQLHFTNPVLLTSGHLAGERVVLSPAVSASDPDGSSFGFKLPPEPSLELSYIFDLIRAAGVQVIINTV